MGMKRSMWSNWMVYQDLTHEREVQRIADQLKKTWDGLVQVYPYLAEYEEDIFRMAEGMQGDIVKAAQFFRAKFRENEGFLVRPLEIVTGAQRRTHAVLMNVSRPLTVEFGPTTGLGIDLSENEDDDGYMPDEPVDPWSKLPSQRRMATLYSQVLKDYYYGPVVAQLNDMTPLLKRFDPDPWATMLEEKLDLGATKNTGSFVRAMEYEMGMLKTDFKKSLTGQWYGDNKETQMGYVNVHTSITGAENFNVGDVLFDKQQGRYRRITELAEKTAIGKPATVSISLATLGTTSERFNLSGNTKAAAVKLVAFMERFERVTREIHNENSFSYVQRTAIDTRVEALVKDALQAHEYKEHKAPVKKRKLAIGRRFRA